MRATYHFLYANIDAFFLIKKITQEKTTGESLSEGYKIWSAKQKLNYEDGCEEKEPPTKRALKSSQVNNLRSLGYLLFSVLGR